MTMTPRELEEQRLEQREKRRSRYYWNGVELRLKEAGLEESGPTKELPRLRRRLKGKKKALY
jgi:hypothetical protein